MLKYLSYLLCGLCLSTQAISMTCFLALAKDSCWTNYEVKLAVTDTATGLVVANIDVPKNRTWVRVKFPCKSEQTLSFKAQYSPVIWQGTEGQQYSAQNYWQLSMESSKTQAQSLNVCFGRDFSEVPTPVNAKSQCVCNMSSIPAVKL